VTHDRVPAIRWALVVATLYLVQIGIVIDLRLFGVHPELMLLTGICAGVAGGASRGAEVGFFAGLLADLVLSGHLGTSALAYAIAGFAAGVVADSVIRSSRAISIGIVAAASVAGVLLYAALGQLLGQDTLSDPRLAQIVGIVSLCNVVLCLPVLALSRWAEGSGVRSGVA
jgi:rod shape-determining protein MreD